MVDFDQLFKAEDLRRAASVPNHPALAVAATFKTIRHVRRFLNDCHTHLTASAPEGETVARALYATHLRLHSLVASAARLDSPECVGAIASLSRTALELQIDVRLLDRGVYTNSGERYWRFVSLDRLRWAQKRLSFEDAHPGVLQPPPDEQREFVAREGPAIENHAMALWGNLKTPHWSGNGDIRQRAAQVDLEDQYIALYMHLSAHGHAGASGIVGLDRAAFDGLASLAHNAILQAVCDSLDAVRVRLGLAERMPGVNLANQVAFLRTMWGWLLLDFKLQSLGDPPRLIDDTPA